jgi:hypothetical protein
MASPDAEGVTDVEPRCVHAHLPVADPRPLDLPADEHLRPPYRSWTIACTDLSSCYIDHPRSAV